MPGRLPEEEVPPRRARVGLEKREPPRVDDFDFFAELFEARPDLLMRVRDNSLDVAGILPGDLAVVGRDLKPREGDVVIVRTDSEVLLRRYQRTREGTVELRPESASPEHLALTLRHGSLDTEIVGVVVGTVVAARGSRAPEEETAPAGN